MTARSQNSWLLRKRFNAGIAAPRGGATLIGGLAADRRAGVALRP
jgi:hypothetical protein